MAARLAFHFCSPLLLASPEHSHPRPLHAAPLTELPASTTSVACSARRPRMFILPSGRTRRAAMAVGTGSIEEVLPPSLNSTAEPPPLFDGTTRLYISYACPYAQRTWIARNYKGLQEKVKLVPIDLQDRPSWYKEKVYSPNKVPSLEHNNEVKGESLDLLKYIDTHFDGPALLSNVSAKKEF
ncbi:hypothetical protein Taro_035686, partial [Colocasia esculenta]|nr:hypothetical protein [Colocasia esculenta]